MEEKRCCVCNNGLEGIYQNIFYDYTIHSKSLLHEIINKILKRDFIKKEENSICHLCVNRINKYESALLLAEQMEKEITELISNTETKYEIIGLTECEEEEERLEIENNIEESNSLDYIELVQDWIIDEEEICQNQIHFEVYEMDDSQNDSSIKEHNEDSDHFVIETVPMDIKPFKDCEKAKRKRLYCDKCDILFSSLAESKQHRESEHVNSISPVQCQKCGISYETRAKLSHHMRTHQDPIKCDLCNKEFTQKGALKRHMAIHTGEKPYQCAICGKQFIHGSSFRMHNLAHGNIREETCEICGYKLRSRSHLNRHMLIHTGVKKHECPKCGQKFAQRYNMNVHLKLHEGIKRQKPASKHICLICNLKFKTLKALNEHHEQYHDVENYDDDKNLIQLENIMEDQSEIYENNSIIDAYSNENVKVELLL